MNLFENAIATRLHDFHQAVSIFFWDNQQYMWHRLLPRSFHSSAFMATSCGPGSDSDSG